ncbi:MULTISPECIES: hypothetical protein [Actinomycetes]|uniref:hypothetical protein n=1 Tax=Actinomycetes TaxID=1760 RepID=UPI0001B5806A|nr:MULTISPECIES: hypothetical protein [Actinomycetes]EFL08124.1 predicted protein [Streptomyces sp. AA4]
MSAPIVILTQRTQRWLPQLIPDARTNGHTWHEFAHALGTSPDYAQLRYDPESPVDDSRLPRDP